MKHTRHHQSDFRKIQEIRPSKRPFVRERMCSRKWVYSTKSKAKQAMRVLLREGSTDLNVYKCPWCGMYHVGHRFPVAGPRYF